LTGVDILRETRTLHLSLEGPSPPVNVGALHQRLLDSHSEIERDAEGTPFKIKYTWTQKVSGTWPQKGSSIGDIAKNAKVRVGQLTAKTWEWTSTQYDAERAVQPGKGTNYTLAFLDNGKFLVTANCGVWKGKYTFGGRSLAIDMSSNWLSGCRKDEVLRVFLDDLARARTAFIEDDRLQVTLAGSEGIMYFEDE